MRREKTIMNEERLGQEKNPPETAVPLDIIAKMVKAACGTVDRSGNSLVFVASSGKTRIDVRSVHATTANGDGVSDVVLIRTELPEQMASFNDHQLVVLNTMAALGALVREKDTGRLSALSRLSVYSGADDAWKLYVPLTAFAALLQGDALVSAGRLAMGEETARLDLPGRDEPSRWSKRDFEFAAERLSQGGMLSNADANGLTAEIPVTAGGVSAVTGDETSLLTFRADYPHLCLGSGLFYKLELPFQFEEDSLVFFANKLNQVEFGSIDAPPFFGAWCGDFESGRLAHVGFWPNLLYQPGTVLNLAVWMITRSKQARGFISLA